MQKNKGPCSMVEQDNLSRVAMVRSPMAPSNPTLLSGGADPVQHLLRPYADLLELPVPEHMRALVENWDREAQPLSGEP
jgi:hypothetical protein